MTGYVPLHARDPAPLCPSKLPAAQPSPGAPATGVLLLASGRALSALASPEERGPGAGGKSGIRSSDCGKQDILPAAARCDMVLRQAFRARRVQTTTSALRCDMVLHWAFSTRHLIHEM